VNCFGKHAPEFAGFCNDIDKMSDKRLKAQASTFLASSRSRPQPGHGAETKPAKPEDRPLMLVTHNYDTACCCRVSAHGTSSRSPPTGSLHLAFA